MSYRSLHTGTAFLLLSPTLRGHKVVAGVTERLQEGVEDAEKVVRLHSGVVFPKVPHRPGKLWRDRQVKVAKTSRPHPLTQNTQANTCWRARPRHRPHPSDTLATPTMIFLVLG